MATTSKLPQPAESKRKRGRPSTYDHAIAERICEGVASGLPLTEVLREDGMPPLTTVCKWSEQGHVASVPEFVAMYARARLAQVEVLADQMLQIADDGTNDYMERIRDGQVDRVPDQEHIQRSRLRVDTRKWLLAKLKPEKYGDALALTGAETTNVTINLANMLLLPDAATQQLLPRNTRAIAAPIIDVEPEDE